MVIGITKGLLAKMLRKPSVSSIMVMQVLNTVLNTAVCKRTLGCRRLSSISVKLLYTQ